MIESKCEATHSGYQPVSRSRHNGKRGTHHSAKTISSIKATPFKGTFLVPVELATKQDEDYQRIKANTSRDKIRDNLVYVKERLYIPDNEAIQNGILESEHDGQIAGHFGQRKTHEIITRNFYWPKMEEWINQYIQTCDTCQRSKSKRHAKYGLLQPLEVPYAPWKSISVDFIVALPESEGFHQIMVVVDRFTKMAHFIPLNENATASDVAKSFLKEVWKQHGLPEDIVSDRDSKWTGEFWEGLCGLLSIKRRLSTAFHPQTDGQTERVNQTLETYLQTFINYDQDD